MFIELNSNPINARVGDCVIRAIAAAENKPWGKIYIDLCIYGLMCADLPTSNNVWGRFLNDHKYQYFALPKRVAHTLGGTVGSPLSVAIALDGEPILTSKAIYQPTVTAEDPITSVGFGGVTSTAIITVPKGCCFNISVENTSESATPTTTPAPTILVQNANLTVTRIA